MVTIERREGIVRSVRSGEVVVRIQQQSACSGCHAKEFCCSTDCADRDVVIHTDEKEYAPGDAVVVYGQNHIGRLAVFLAFVLPLVLLLVLLVVAIKLLHWPEALAISLSLGGLTLYYLILRLVEPKLGRIMRFGIIKAE